MMENAPIAAVHPEAPVTLTEAAARAILAKAAKEGQPGAAMRVRVKGGGCSGATYVMTFETDPAAGDFVTTQHGARMFVDPRSIVFLKGSTLDYKAELMSQRFLWTNPNAKSSCGCGESFAV
jgi:iron-sulfur cluster assembly protein